MKTYTFKDRDTRYLLLTGWKAISLLILVTFDSNWWHFITADLPMNLQARLYLWSSCGSWVMLQIVLKWKFFIKRPLSHQLPYIKLLFKLHPLHYTDVQNIQYNNRLNYDTKHQKSIFSGWTTTGGMSNLKAKIVDETMLTLKMISQATQRSIKIKTKYRFWKGHLFIFFQSKRTLRWKWYGASEEDSLLGAQYWFVWPIRYLNHFLTAIRYILLCFNT